MMRRPLLKGTALGFLGLQVFLAAAGDARADTIVLKSGGRLRPLSWSLSGERIVLETDSGTITLDRSEVAAIERDGGAPTLLPAPARIAAPQGTGPGDRKGRALAVLPPDGLPQEVRLTLNGHEAFHRGDYAAALSLYQRALSADPGFTPAAVSAASAALALGDASGAAERARGAVALDPASADGWAVLGQAWYRLDRLAEAEDALARSVGLDARDDRREFLERVRREREASARFAAWSTPHFRVEYDGEVMPRMGREALAFLEDTFDEMTRSFRYTPPGSLTVIFYPRESFHELTGADAGIGGLYDGKVRIPLGGPDRLTAEVRRVLRHELAHGFIDSMTRGNAPRWLHEGLAQRMEPASARGRERQLLAWFRQDESRWGEQFNYLAALSFVEHLQGRFGDLAVLNLLERLGAGAEPEAALRAAFSFGYDDLVGDWRASVGGGGR